MRREGVAEWRRWLRAISLVGLISLIGLSSWTYRALAVPLQGPGSAELFTVRAGQSASDIASSLERARIIRSAGVIRLYLRLTHRTLQAGVYSLSQRGSSLQNIQPIIDGRISERQVTIPEGLRLNEIAQRLEAVGIVLATDFVRAARYQPALMPLLASYNLKADTGLEGFLFPDTYRLSAATTATDVLERLITTYRTRTAGLSIDYDTLILASIVEREAKFDADRPLIAGVYANRLKRGMALQADPTVEYARANANCAPQPLEDCLQTDWWPQPSSSDFRALDSPYNTYRVTGLPPRPISNPGLASIEAAIHPSDHRYLYFVTDREGQAHFATTLTEHTQNVAKYLK
jgi:UPF0755 protein